MKPAIRYQSQLLFRKSYKPNRLIRIRPAQKPKITFRPMRRIGLKPKPELVWCDSSTGFHFFEHKC